MSPEIFDKLPKLQFEAVSLVSVNAPPRATKRTMDALEKKGLIAYHERSSSDRFGKFTWSEPYMPLDAHMAWCEWCSKNCPELVNSANEA